MSTERNLITEPDGHFRGSYEKVASFSYAEPTDDLPCSVGNKTGVDPDPGPVICPMSKNQILKNLAVLSIAFVFLFTAFFCISNLQSSLNKEEGVGSGSVAIIYASLLASCMFLVPIIIATFGCKWTIPISIVGYALYNAANFYAIWELMAPAAVAIGVGASSLWSAKGTYLTQISVWYSRMTGMSEDAIINRFFGIFFGALHTSQIWGNVISSEVFSQRPENSSRFPNKSSDELELCGANYCPQKVNETLRPPDEKVYIVCGITTGLTVLAIVFVAIFLDNIVLDKEQASRRKISCRLLIATFSHLFKSCVQMLLVPLTVYTGIEQGFIWGTFTRAYVTCAIGIWNIGYVLIVYGVTDAVCSFSFGRLVQYVGHIPFFVLAFVLHCGCLVTCRLWMPIPDQLAVFYVVAAIWGMGDAIIQTQINALYGCLFTDNTEAAFTNFRLWQSFGFMLTYAYNDFLCVDAKIYVCAGFLVVGMVCYGVVEAIERRRVASWNPSPIDTKQANSHEL